MFLISVLLVGDVTVKMAPKCSAQGLPSDPQCEKAVMCLMERTRVLGKLCSGMSHRTAGHAFNVNTSTIHSMSVSEGKH